jgi:hypothetical protein
MLNQNKNLDKTGNLGFILGRKQINSQKIMIAYPYTMMKLSHLPLAT